MIQRSDVFILRSCLINQDPSGEFCMVLTIWSFPLLIRSFYCVDTCNSVRVQHGLQLSFQFYHKILQLCYWYHFIAAKLSIHVPGRAVTQENFPTLVSFVTFYTVDRIFILKFYVANHVIRTCILIIVMHNLRFYIKFVITCYSIG